MNDNVVNFPGAGNPEDVASSDVLESTPIDEFIDLVREADLSEALVVGWTSDGLFWATGTSHYLPDSLALLDVAKKAILQMYERG